MPLEQVFARLPDPQSHAFPDYSLPRGEPVLPIAVTREELTTVLELYESFQRVDPTGLNANPFLEAATTYMEQTFGVPRHRPDEQLQDDIAATLDDFSDDLAGRSMGVVACGRRHTGILRPNRHGRHRATADMERHEFYQSVQYEANLAGEADARNATQAVLSALGERLDEDLSQHLDGQLPDEIGDHLVEGASERRFDYDEFLERIEERTDRAAVGEPQRLVAAVVGTLLEHVDDEDSERVRERLEDLDFEEAIPEAGPGARS